MVRRGTESGNGRAPVSSATPTSQGDIMNFKALALTIGATLALSAPAFASESGTSTTVSNTSTSGVVVQVQNVGPEDRRHPDRRQLLEQQLAERRHDRPRPAGRARRIGRARLRFVRILVLRLQQLLQRIRRQRRQRRRGVPGPIPRRFDVIFELGEREDHELQQHRDDVADVQRQPELQQHDELRLVVQQLLTLSATS